MTLLATRAGRLFLQNRTPRANEHREIVSPLTLQVSEGQAKFGDALHSSDEQAAVDRRSDAANGMSHNSCLYVDKRRRIEAHVGRSLQREQETRQVQQPRFTNPKSQSHLFCLRLTTASSKHRSLFHFFFSSLPWIFYFRISIVGGGTHSRRMPPPDGLANSANSAILL